MSSYEPLLRPPPPPPPRRVRLTPPSSPSLPSFPAYPSLGGLSLPFLSSLNLPFLPALRPARIARLLILGTLLGLVLFRLAGSEDVDMPRTSFRPHHPDVPALHFTRAPGYDTVGDPRASSPHRLLPTLRHPSPPPAPPPEPDTILPPHTYAPTGQLYTNPYGRHPVYDLMRRAREEWREKVGRQSGSLKEAVGEYRRRYGREPPRGFDGWWAYVQRHEVQLPDEYDQIHRDLSPFYALPPRQLRASLLPLSSLPSTYTLLASPRPPSISSLFPSDEADSTLDLLTADGESWIPDPGQVDPAVWARWEGLIGSVEEELVRATGGLWNATFFSSSRSLFSEDAGQGWAEACPPNSPARARSRPKKDEGGKAFVARPEQVADPCLNPSLPLPHPGAAAPAAPVFATCKSPLGHEVVVPSSEGWTARGAEVPWWGKESALLLWNTTLIDAELPAQHLLHNVPKPPLIPLHRHAKHGRGSKKAKHVEPEPPKMDVLLPAPREVAVGGPVMREAEWLDGALVDVDAASFREEDEEEEEEEDEEEDEEEEEEEELDENDGDAKGAPVKPAPPKGGKEAGTGKGKGKGEKTKDDPYKMFEKAWEIEPEAQDLYKFAIDVDGEECSSQFRRLLQSNSVVLKAGLYREWYADRIQPWLHYVPLSPDLSDLYDILTFFRGDVLNRAFSNSAEQDKIAEEVAKQGREWARRYWRREDMIAYMYRLFLEYGRLMSDDRERMNFKL